MGTHSVAGCDSEAQPGRGEGWACGQGLAGRPIMSRRSRARFACGATRPVGGVAAHQRRPGAGLYHISTPPSQRLDFRRVSFPQRPETFGN